MNKLTRLEKYWILYDVGNSAFILLVSTIIPIYFNYLASLADISEVDYLAYWGYAASIATMIVAIIGPVLGSLVDTAGYKKPIFTISMMCGVLGLALLSVPTDWIIFLAIFVIAKVGYNASLIIYDAMLLDITDENKIDYVSSFGYAYGYIGSCIPFMISLLIVLGYKTINISFNIAMMLAFIINALWWFIMSFPLLKHYKQIHFVEKPKHPIKDSFIRILNTLKDIKKEKKIFIFLISFFFYIDGVYTIIEMATAYGSALGLDTTGLLLALLVTQIIAFPFALLFARLSKTKKTESLIRICIIAYICIAIFAIQLDQQWEFWILAIFVGMFQGAIQALSRSYYAKIIPQHKSGEFFGLYDICGKGASFLGTSLVGAVAQITGYMNIGVAIIAVMICIGFILFNKASSL